MTGLNRSVMMYHRLLALSFLMVTTVFFATSCKSSKKKSSAGGGGNLPTETLSDDGVGDPACAAQLTAINPPPQTSLSSLNLTGVEIENVQVGNYNSAKIIFSCIYQI